MSEGLLRIVIHEGRNRQVRRMCAAVGHEVTRLVRTRIGPLSDATLPPGASRQLSASPRCAGSWSRLASSDEAASTLPT